MDRGERRLTATFVLGALALAGLGLTVMASQPGEGDCVRATLYPSYGLCGRYYVVHGTAVGGDEARSGAPRLTLRLDRVAVTNGPRVPRASDCPTPLIDPQPGCFVDNFAPIGTGDGQPVRYCLGDRMALPLSVTEDRPGGAARSHQVVEQTMPRFCRPQ